MTRLEFRVRKFLGNNKDIRKTRNKYSCLRSPYKVKIPVKFTEDLCRFVGIMHGDGNMSFSRIHVSDKSLVYHEKVICSIFHKLFGIKLHIFEDKQRHTYYSHIKCRIIYKYLTEVLELPIGPIRNQLTVPGYLKKLKNNLKAGYVGGLFDSEGHISKRQAVASFSTTNKQVFDFVRLFLKSNKIDFSIYIRDRRLNREYEIYIYGKDRLKRLNESIKIKHPDKVDRLNMFSVY